MSIIRSYYPDATEDELDLIKQREFASWLQFYVSDGISKGQTFPSWLVEFVNGPNYITTSYPRYCSRGYAFKIHQVEKTRSTSDYGVSAQSGDIVYYGVLNEILEVHYPGMLDLRCIAFMCEWYDPFIGRGIQVDEFGVTSVHSRRRLIKYDPFILASQADQVCFIPYPRVRNKKDPWITVTSINPRGRIHGVADHDPLQQSGFGHIPPIEHSLAVDLVVDFSQFRDNVIHSESEGEVGEFDDDSDSIPSDYSTDSD